MAETQSPPTSPMPADAETKLGETQVVLPSQGRLYAGRIPDGRVYLRRMTAEQAARLLTSGTPDDRVSHILKATCRLPGGFDHKDLLVGDRMYLLIAERCLTYGSAYKITFKCPYCGNLNKDHVVDLAKDLTERPAGADLSEPVQIALPDSGKSVSMRFLRGTDEEAIKRHAKRSAATGGGEGDDAAYLHRLARLLVLVEGEDPGDIVVRERFIGGLPAGDVVHIDNTMEGLEPGVDISIAPECHKCGTPNDMVLPMTAEFFRPTAVRR